MQLRLIYSLKKKCFEFFFDKYLWDLDYFEIIRVYEQAKKQSGSPNLVLDFQKSPTNTPDGPALLRFDNSGKFSAQIADYLKQVVGSYQTVFGIPDGQNRK
jgi:hypothetical protein